MGSRVIVQVHNGKSVNLLACIYPYCKFGKTCQAHPSSFRVCAHVPTHDRQEIYSLFRRETFSRAFSLGKKIRQSFAWKYLWKLHTFSRTYSWDAPISSFLNLKVKRGKFYSKTRGYLCSCLRRGEEDPSAPFFFPPSFANEVREIPIP